MENTHTDNKARGRKFLANALPELKTVIDQYGTVSLSLSHVNINGYLKKHKQ